MNFQADHTWGPGPWKTKNVGEVSIKCHKDSSSLDRKGSDPFIWRSRQARFSDGNCIVTLLAEESRVLRR